MHGPLMALLMVEAVRRTSSHEVAEVEYRLQSPVFVGEEILVDGATDEDSVRLRID